jgi:hypothetical protein
MSESEVIFHNFHVMDLELVIYILLLIPFIRSVIDTM